MAHRRLVLGFLTCLALLSSATLSLAAEKVTVFAAASLKNALDTVASEWSAKTSKLVSISYAASSALAKQIEQGAPADIFFSADLAWMKYLQDKGLIAAGSDVALLGNELVLVVPKDSTATVEIKKDVPLAQVLGEGRLAMADVNSVPAGKYGKLALESLGVWSTVKVRLAQAENVRAALRLVALGEAPAGIVYRTDARAEAAVRVVAAFPAASHPPIIYPLALVAGSTNADASDFLSFLQTPQALAIFRREGFTVLSPPATN